MAFALVFRRTLRGVASARVILRLRGHYFAVGSLAVVEILRLGASSWHGLTGGGTGLNVPILQGGPDFASRIFLYSMLSLALTRSQRRSGSIVRGLASACVAFVRTRAPPTCWGSMLIG